MTVKEYLRQTFAIDRLITAKKYQIQKLITQLDGTGIRYSHDKVKGSSVYPDKMAEMITSLSLLQDFTVVEITRLLRLKYDISLLISHVKNHDYRLVLYERYINLKIWRDVAYDNNLGWNTVHRFHRYGLKELEKEIKDLAPATRREYEISNNQ